MTTRLYIALAVAILAAFAIGYLTPVTLDDGHAPGSFLPGVTRYEDAEAGVLCYAFVTRFGTAVDCVPMKDTDF